MNLLRKSTFMVVLVLILLMGPGNYFMPAVSLAASGPVLTTTSGSTAFVAGDNVTSTPVVIDSDITVTDDSSTTLKSATVAITGNFHSGEDVLAFTNDGSTMGNISASYNGTTGVLTLTSAGATATLAQWQSALRSITYTDTAVTPNAATRTISFTAIDGAVNTSNTATRTVTVIDTDQSPIVTTTGVTTDYEAGTTAVTIDEGVSVTDLDNATQSSGRVSIGAGFHAGDTLTFVNSNTTTFGNIVGSYNSATGVLTLTSSGAVASDAQWSNALSAVTFSASSSAISGMRTISFDTNDGSKTSSAATSSVNVKGLPYLAATGGPTSFVAGDNAASTPVVIDSGITVTDGRSTTLASATVSITAGHQRAEDNLRFANDGSTMGNITANYDDDAGVLTLTSAGATATLAQWQSALRSITYTDLTITPDATTRTISFTAIDGAGNTSNTAIKTVTVTDTDQSPIVTTTGGTTDYIGGTLGVAIDSGSGITVTDLDHTKLAGATVSVSGGYQNGDILSFIVTGPIIGSFDTTSGVLTMTAAGGATLSQWQSALRSVSFFSSSSTRGLRTISYTVNDGVKTSSAATNSVRVITDTTKPAVTFGGFTADQIFAAPPASITASVSEAVYWVADGELLTSSNALSLVSMEKDSAAFSAYTASYDEPSRTYTMTFDSPLVDGVYKVNVAGSVVENVYHNTLEQTSSSFMVAVPVVSQLTANPLSLASAGGSILVTLSGSNLLGQSVQIYLDGTAAATATIASATSAEATVMIPPNTDTSAKTHTITIYVNGMEVAGKLATVTVSGKPLDSGSGSSGGSDSNSDGDSGESTPSVGKQVIDQNGVPLDPDKIDTTKPSVTLELTPKDGEAYVSIPAGILSSLEGRNANFFIEVEAPYGKYQVPVNLASLIPGLQNLLAANKVNAEDISFKITLTDKSGDKEILAALDNNLPKSNVMGSIVDFSIEVIVSKTGQFIGTADKFSKALTRMIPLPRNVVGMPEQWGAFRYNAGTKKFDFVAATTSRVEGVPYVMINSYSNSVYVVAENAVSFADEEQHWSKPFVRQAAAKGLIEGVSSSQFAPDKSVTRAEFTAMLVRALGGVTSAAGNAVTYDDVKPGSWYYDDIAKAKEIGLLDFAGGSSFMPDQPLTRQEMASMLAAAIKSEMHSTAQDHPVNLDNYNDIGSVDADFLEDVRLMVQLHIMTGTSEDTFSPQDESTRAQAAVVFIRMLKAIGMID